METPPSKFHFFSDLDIFWVRFGPPSETVAHERIAVGEARTKSEQCLSFVHRYAACTGSQHTGAVRKQSPAICKISHELLSQRGDQDVLEKMEHQSTVLY